MHMQTAQTTLYEIKFKKQIVISNFTKQNSKNVQCINQIAKANCKKGFAQDIMYITNCAYHNTKTNCIKLIVYALCIES